MAKEEKTNDLPVDGSAKAGNPDELIAGPADANQPGEPKPVSAPATPDLNEYVPKHNYEELEKKLGEQGNELGELRGFLNQITPLLDKLHDDPELAEAIVEGKIDSKMVDAIVNKEVTTSDATAVAKAHEEVKKELGAKKYDKMEVADIEKLVEAKFNEFKNEIKVTESKIDKKLGAVEERRQFEKSVEDFIKETPDFPEYADKIVGWLDKHPDQYDIQIAYHAVKGMELSAKSAQDREVQAAEAAKNVAANASGGGSQISKVLSDDKLVDRLIGSSSNPNTV